MARHCRGFNLAIIIMQLSPVNDFRVSNLQSRMAVDHYENFPVASILLPRRLVPAVEAIYAFARSADETFASVGARVGEEASVEHRNFSGRPQPDRQPAGTPEK